MKIPAGVALLAPLALMLLAAQQAEGRGMLADAKATAAASGSATPYKTTYPPPPKAAKYPPPKAAAKYLPPPAKTAAQKTTAAKAAAKHPPPKAAKYAPPPAKTTAAGGAASTPNYVAKTAAPTGAISIGNSGCALPQA